MQSFVAATRKLVTIFTLTTIFSTGLNLARAEETPEGASAASLTQAPAAPKPKLDVAEPMAETVGPVAEVAARPQRPAAATEGPLSSRAEDRTDKARYDLSAQREIGVTRRIEIQLEVGGHLTITGQGKVERLPMSVAAEMKYDEKLLLADGDTKGQLRSARWYDAAKAIIKIEKGGVTPTLTDKHRLLICDIDRRETTIFSPSEPLTRDDLDLVSIVGNSLVLEELLPVEPVAIGETWQHDADAVVALLGLDATASSEVQSTLTAVEEDVAKITLSGIVSGAVEGVVTDIELKAKYHVNLTTHEITGFNMAVKEKRSIGHVGPGLEVIARLKMQIQPVATPENLSDERLANIETEPTAQARRLLYEPEGAGYRFLSDRRWYSTNEGAKILVLRMVDRGDLVAQCNITPLIARSTDKAMSLEQYQGEVRQALGKNFGQFVKAAQWTDQVGQRVFRVVVQGQVDTLPIEWRYYLVHHPSGKRLAAVVTVEGSLIERLGDADRELVDTIEIAAPRPGEEAEKAAPTDTEKVPATAAKPAAATK